MNLIEALKVNGKARIKGKEWAIFVKNCFLMIDNQASEGPWAVNYNQLTRDDWEPVIENKVWEGKTTWERTAEGGVVYPLSTSGGVDWTKFIGKTTKIRIEWEE